MKTYILTQSGERFDFNKPETARFTIEDVAHGLSHICRFVGQTRKFYSVAQHSVLVSRVVPAPYALAGLLHDAPEAFIGDVATPLKRMLPDYQAIELRVETAVLAYFGLTLPLHPEVKRGDSIALVTEARDLMNGAPEDYAVGNGIEPLDEIIVPLSPRRARALFLKRYRELTANPALRRAA